MKQFILIVVIISVVSWVFHVTYLSDYAEIDLNSSFLAEYSSKTERVKIIKGDIVYYFQKEKGLSDEYVVFGVSESVPVGPIGVAQKEPFKELSLFPHSKLGEFLKLVNAIGEEFNDWEGTPDSEDINEVLRQLRAYRKDVIKVMVLPMTTTSTGDLDGVNIGNYVRIRGDLFKQVGFKKKEDSFWLPAVLMHDVYIVSIKEAHYISWLNASKKMKSLFNFILNKDQVNFAEKPLFLHLDEDEKIINSDSVEQEATFNEVNWELEMTEEKSLPRYYVEKINNIPDLSQAKVLSNLPGRGYAYCAPTSVANSFIWLDDNGFDRLVKNTHRWRVDDQIDLIKVLGTSNYMDTNTKIGTNTKRFVTGIDKFVKDKGYSYKRLEYQGIWDYASGPFSTKTFIPKRHWIKKGILGYGSVWLHIGYYNYNIFKDQYVRIAGHTVTLVGYGVDENNIANRDYLVIHNPSDWSGDFFRNEYILLEKIASGKILRNKRSFIKAKGFCKITKGLPLPKGANAAIIETAIILEMYPPGNLF